MSGCRGRGMLVLTWPLLAGAVVPISAQQHCLPADGSEQNIASYATQLATSADSIYVATRDLYGILPVAASEVEVMIDKDTCQDAKAAYKASIGFSGSRKVHVVRVGTRYIVFNPDTKAGGYVTHVVYDSAFNELHMFAS